jgi:hypothetical protein
MKKETLEEAIERLYPINIIYGGDNNAVFRSIFVEGVKWEREQDKNKYSEEDMPTNLESVLAKITHINDLGLSQWYEVVYYDNDRWCSYSGSKTFQDGEKVIDWKYCKDLI